METNHDMPLYGLLAEFESPQALLDAIEQTYAEGYEDIDAYSPYAIEEVCHAVARHKKSHVSKIVLCGGILGALTGFGLQWWTAAVDYPLNIGGRPLFSWPAFIPVTFEMTILFSAFSAVIGMLALNGLPEPYHPLFAVERFERATQDGYFLVIEARDSRFDREGTRAFLEGLKASEVIEVES